MLGGSCSAVGWARRGARPAPGGRIADLAALAAAAARLRGAPDAVRRGRGVAAAAGGRLESCQDLVDGSVLVVVAVPACSARTAGLAAHVTGPG